MPNIPVTNIWATPWENVSSGVSDQVRLKLACWATEASMTLKILVTETRDITLSRQRTTKALIRLRGCTGWSAPLLFACGIRHIFSWPDSYFLRNYESHSSYSLTFFSVSAVMAGYPYLSHVMRKPVMPYANNKGAGQPTRISAFVVRCLDRIIALVYIVPISRL